MFENLSRRLGDRVRNLSGLGRLTEDNIRDTLRDIRIALLEADVALPVVKKFVEDVRQKAVGQTVLRSLKPGEALVGVVRQELVRLLGDEDAALNLRVAPPAVILLAGLQGAGKTTTAAKLARYLQAGHGKDAQKKSVLLTGVDIYRPAAVEQLRKLAADIDVPFFAGEEGERDPVAIARRAVDYAKTQFIDVVIVDTAGRLHVDAEMMTEARNLHEATRPAETLFVIDSMAGQDAVNVAKAFNDSLELTGVMLTKTDGDARGGAALSVRETIGKPIKFIGVGEKIDALEAFHPERMASRILGMGDVLSLVEQAERSADKAATQKLAKKFKKGKGFDLQDFADQIDQMNKMGGLAAIAGKLPGMGKMAQAVKSEAHEKQLRRTKALIQSMTPQERRHPAIIKGTRKRRIVAGSGTQVQDLNRLIKQFTQMQKMMKKFGKGGGKAMMRGLQQQVGGGMNIPF